MFHYLQHNDGDFAFDIAPSRDLFALVQSRQMKSSNRVSVVIGPNGSGKSKLLRSIADQFASGDSSRSRYLDSNGESTAPPSRLLAITNMVTDVFPFTAKMDGYRYLGLRQNTNFASTGSLRDATAISLAQCLVYEGRRGMLQPVFDLLEVKGVSMSFHRSRSRPRNRESREDIVDRFLKGKRSTRDALASDPNWAGTRLVDSLERVTEHLPPAGASRLESYLDGDDTLSDFASISRTFGIEIGELVALAKRAGFAEWDVTFRTSRRFRTLDEMSAGQLLQMSLFARLAAYIAPDALVLIDEPETGLHPSWQSAFVPLLLASLPVHYGSHLFVATHSPHVVTDASDVLVPGERWGIFDQFEEPYYGRSVENLLYRAFGARVTGNTEVDNDLLTVMQYVSGETSGRDAGTVMDALNRLRRVAGPDTALLNDVLGQVAERLDFGR